MFTHRMLQWLPADDYGRPMFWTQAGWGSSSDKKDYPINYFLNSSDCSPQIGYCGKQTVISDWAAQEAGALQYDMQGTLQLGVGMGGDVPVMKHPATTYDYTIKMDSDGSGSLHTMLYTHTSAVSQDKGKVVTVQKCPQQGCWPPFQPPDPPPLPSPSFSLWSSGKTWNHTTDDTRNPLNTVEIDTFKSTPTMTVYRTVEKQVWSAATPSDYDNVWIPKWRNVLLDVSTPVLGHLVIEGTLVINASSSVDITATWIEIKGGSLIIATCDSFGNILGPFEGSVNMNLIGTNEKLSAVHGENPRETPELILGKDALVMGPAVIGVMGTFIAKVPM